LGAVLLAGYLASMAGRSLAVLRQSRDLATPALVVPAVGLLDLPLAAPQLQLSASLHDALVACWAAGLALSVPLLAAVLWRLLRGVPLPAPMLPTVLILVAPAAVGSSGHALLSGGHVDLLSVSLFAVAALLLVALAAQLRQAWRAPFRTIWWATSFPLAASAIASLLVASTLQSPLAKVLAAALLGIATIAIAVLSFHTLRGLVTGKFREIV
jgi:tellurite resistance protein